MTLVASYPERWAKKQLTFVGLFINFVFHFAGAMEQLTGSRSYRETGAERNEK